MGRVKQPLCRPWSVPHSGKVEWRKGDVHFGPLGGSLTLPFHKTRTVRHSPTKGRGRDPGWLKFYVRVCVPDCV